MSGLLLLVGCYWFVVIVGFLLLLLCCWLVIAVAGGWLRRCCCLLLGCCWCCYLSLPLLLLICCLSLFYRPYDYSFFYCRLGIGNMILSLVAGLFGETRCRVRKLVSQGRCRDLVVAWCLSIWLVAIVALRRKDSCVWMLVGMGLLGKRAHLA